MKQPEALRLAKILDNIEGYRATLAAAAELRRLHEANQAMLEALELIANTGMDARQCHYYARSAIAKGEQQ